MLGKARGSRHQVCLLALGSNVHVNVNDRIGEVCRCRMRVQRASIYVRGETIANNATTTAGRVLRPVGGPGRSPNVHGIKINACYIGEIKDGVGERYTRNGVRGRAAGSKGGMKGRTARWMVADVVIWPQHS